MSSRWIFLPLPARRATPWSTTLSGTRSGWAPASRRISTCRRSEAPPACWAHDKLAPTIFSVCVSVATTPARRCPWSLGRNCCECSVLVVVVTFVPLNYCAVFFCFTCVSVTDLQDHAGESRFSSGVTLTPDIYRCVLVGQGRHKGLIFWFKVKRAERVSIHSSIKRNGLVDSLPPETNSLISPLCALKCFFNSR